ncbi:MAG: threonine--tRNA ligase, partial [Bdellovibrionales bacterium]|nr:threonine--tRNA ligase [Bdellovibrionales bacterium]
MFDAIEPLGEEALKDTIGVKVGGRLLDLQSPLPHGGSGRIVRLKEDSAEARLFYRHSMSHVLAQAVKRLYPSAKLAIGPAIAEGFYYDFDVERPFTPDDLEKITAEMKKIIKENHRFERLSMSVDEARKLLQEMDEPYKLELLEEFADRGEAISFYRDGDFTDLCAGPHVRFTGQVKHFKLLEVAGAYWRGDENRKMLQRIYGTAFLSKEDLEQYLWQLEEAKKRDHRRLGKDLDLFSSRPDTVGGGLILWHPKGGLVRHLIEEHCKRKHLEGDYSFVYTPHIGKADLWKTSGHLEFYKDGMYAPIDIEGQQYYLKPMNCPFHTQIFSSDIRSYRDLPLRFAEWGTVYRFERSGTLHGLTRVRGFTQDDAHLFCRPDQMPEEIDRVLAFSLDMLRDFGFRDFKLFLST